MQLVNGYVDAEGRLIAADPRLLALHIAAGGAEGGKLAIPQLASLARIARSLSIPVSRPVIIAEAERTLEVLARAKLEEGSVHLTLVDLDNAKSVGIDTNLDAPDRAASFAKLEQSVSFETNEALEITHAAADMAAVFSAPMADPIGKALGTALTLIKGPDGGMPILSALVQQQGFAGQWAHIPGHEARRLILSGDPALSAAGQLNGYRCTVRAAEAADTVNAQQATELSGVAHRLDAALRTPIGRIIENSDAIHSGTEGELKAEYQEYGADISSAGRHLLGLVDDLVDLQAIERNDFHVARDAIDLADIARRAAGLLAVRAADKRVKIDRPDGDEILIARGEFRRVLQILVNLIGNAVRYSPDDSMVWIRTEQDGDLAVVIIADQGKGIAVADQARIFEKFERIDTAEPGGSGLGLYIARRLARAMGGDITVDSAPGLGARFALTLPTV
jgi:signal transduction histidine kinase